MADLLSRVLPIPPALVYLLHQLKVNGIGYNIYGHIPGTQMVFVDLDRDYAQNLCCDSLPSHWSVITPHFLANRALVSGHADPIQTQEMKPESIVLAYGDDEAQFGDSFNALCAQVRYLQQHCPSRLVYHNGHPPEPMEIHGLIGMLKSRDY